MTFGGFEVNPPPYSLQLQHTVLASIKEQEAENREANKEDVGNCCRFLFQERQANMSPSNESDLSLRFFCSKFVDRVIVEVALVE